MKNIIDLKDWEEIKGKDSEFLKDAFIAEDIDSLDRDKNLGLFKSNDKKYTSGYNGICYRTKSNGALDYNTILHVATRFKLNVDEMISIISEDDEFEQYLFGSRGNDKYYHSNEDSVLIKFYDKQPLIKTNDALAQNASILFSMQFILSIKALCMKPLYHTIERQESNFIGKVKGKILINKNIKYNTVRARNERIYCQYGTSTTDNLPNRILKASLKKAMSNISNKSKNNSSAYLKILQAKAFCDEALRGVSDVKITKKDFVGLKITGTYAHYNKVLSLAKIIICNFTLLNKEGKVSTYFTYPFAINMQMLFECYCRTLIKNNLAKLRKKAGKKNEIPILMPYNFAEQTLEKDLYIQGKLKPDIILKFDDGGKKSYFVYDVKYKNKQNYNLGTRSDRLQILAYAYFYNTEKFGLIFPALPKNKQEKTLSGNTDTSPSKTYYEVFVENSKNIGIPNECFLKGEKS